MGLAISGMIVANATLRVQHSNALVQYPSSSLRTLNNRNVHFVKAPLNYAWSKNPNGVDTLKSVSGVKWAFRTKYLLPVTHTALGKSIYDMTNPQAAVVTGNYLFVLYAPHNTIGKGFIVRYDLNKLNQMSLGSVQAALGARPATGMRVGPQFTVGHGQSLAYDQKHHSLWMWRDRADMKPTTRATIQKISPSKLKPEKIIQFSMNHHGANVPAGHNLTFDHSGHAYWWETSNNKVKLYRGIFGEHSVKVSLTKQLLRKRTGTHEQTIGYNAHNGRLYLVSDDSVQTLPARKTYGNGHLKPSDIKYTRFHSGREFEGLTFDHTGHAMLLTNRNPELMRSTSRY